MSTYDDDGPFDDTLDGEETDDRIAVIGMAGRFPGAPDLDTYWSNLRRGVESIVRFDEDTLRRAGVPEEEWRAPSYVAAGAPITDFDRFDADFFRFTPREAEGLDPQHRVFLGTAYHALEDAGLRTDQLPDRVGVWGGARFSDYLIRHVYANEAWLQRVGYFQALLGNEKDYLAPMVSYRLDLGGPSVTVQTACSTSLVAVQSACDALISHAADLGLAGGVSLRFPQHAGYHYHPNGIFSPTGRVRTFDAAADGTVFGNGVGVMVLKRLDDALADGDFVYGVIRGASVNNDGGRKVGFTAPAVDGQARVIADALALAELEPSDIDYVECHGTGTTLGDAIEVSALAKVFHGVEPGSCALGAVKSNIGHLEAAAGVAGLIKVLLMLHHRRLVPSLHFESPNPQIPLDGSPFRVQTEDVPWPAPTDGPRRAGLSSFGIGGTNAHVVVEEAPERPAARTSDGPYVLRLSARGDAAVGRGADALANHLERRPDADLDAVATSLWQRRRPFESRRAVVVSSVDDAVKSLRDDGGPAVAGRVSGESRLVFLFPGQGVQYPGMARGLHAMGPTARELIDRGADVLRGLLGFDLRDLLLEPADGTNAAERLRRTSLTQPALFLVEYAAVRQWMAWGYEPAAMLGHSVGEYVAACVAGVFDFEDGLRLLAERGRLVEAQPGGAMVSVQRSPRDLEDLLTPGVEIAVRNGPALTSVSGSEEAIDTFVDQLRRDDIMHRRLHTSHAFHSSLLEGAMEPFRRVLATVDLRPPQRPFLSNVTGDWIRDDEATDPGYWVEHLRRPVDFAKGLRTVGEGLFLELGPGRTASTLARATWPGAVTVQTQPGAVEGAVDPARLRAEAVARLWVCGVDGDAEALGAHGASIPLPGYPFVRDRHWLEATGPPGGQRPASSAPEDPEAAETSEVDESPSKSVMSKSVDSNRPEGLPTAHVEPADDLERRLASIWEEQLGVHPVGRNDNFFDLGGHSLLATRVLARLHEALGVELALEDFFRGEEGRPARLRDLAEAVRRTESAEPTPGPALAVVPRPESGAAAGLPLTAAQERLWFLHRLAPEDPSYNLPGVFPVDGPFDPDVMEGTLHDLLARHELLRCHFVFPNDAGGGRPVAQVLPIEVARDRFTLPVVDLTDLDDGARQARVQELADTDARQPFALEHELPLRASVLRLAPEHHLLLLNLHHIACDGGSFGLLARDVGKLYRARLTGTPADLPELPVQFLDYAAWQRAALDGERLAHLEGQGKQRLAGAPLVLELGTDFPRPAVPDAEGARVPVALDVDTSAALRRLCRDRGVTPFMALLTVFQVLLWNRTGHRDFLLGTHVSQRRRRELEGLIGLFVNQVVLRAQIQPDTGFEQRLDAVRDDVLAAMAHQDLPFERLVDVLEPERDLSRNPVVQVFFVLQNHVPVETSAATSMTDGRAVRLPPPSTDGPQVVRDDLRLELFDDPDHIHGFFEFRTALFESATVERLADQFVRWVERLVDDSDARLDHLAVHIPHLTDDALHTRHQLLRRSSLELGPPLHVRILAQADAQPNTVAVVSEDEPVQAWQHLTYGQLADLSGRLAERLRHLGVGPEVKVGLFMERSTAFVIGWMGIWQAGGSYVPLDLQAPAPRLKYQLDTVDAPAILTLSTWADTLTPTVTDGRTVLELDNLLVPDGSAPSPSESAPVPDGSEDGPQQTSPRARSAGGVTAKAPLSKVHQGPTKPSTEHRAQGNSSAPHEPPQQPATNTERHPQANPSAPQELAQQLLEFSTFDPKQLAYVLFTSGSTGEPKGVAVEHQQLSYYVDAMIHRLELERTSYAWILATTADAGHTVLFPTLAMGGCLHAIAPRISTDPAALGDYLERHGIESMKVMPSLLQALQTGDQAARVLPSKHLVMTGEPSQLSWIESLRRLAPGLRIDNEYGPTEATVGVTTERFDGLDLTPYDAWPIGTALPGTSCHLVDFLDRPVAGGQLGELHLGGDLVTRGYIRQPARTAETFIPDPWGTHPGARRYRTGDHARLDHDGNLLFHGRIDGQIKVRGFRVEPGEIESTLREHDAVEAAVVRLVGERLVAYVVTGSTSIGGRHDDPLSAELRTWVSQRLPPAMVPSAVVPLDALPLSPNGKLNSRALPPPPQPGDGVRRDPDTPVARQLAVVWCQVLGLDAVGLDDNFFDVGGDSLLSIRLMALAHRAGLPLTPQLLFRHQTLGELADVLAQQGAADDFDQRALVLLQPAGTGTPIVCVHPAGGMVFGYLDLARALGDAAPFFALQDVHYMAPSLETYTVRVEELAKRYLPEVLEACPEGPIRLMGHSFGGLVALDLARRLQEQGCGVEQVVLLDTEFPASAAPPPSDPRLTTLAHITSAMHRLRGQESPWTEDRLAPLDEPERLLAASEALTALGGYDDMTPKRLAVTVTLYAAHNAAARAYEPSAWDGPVLLCRPEEGATAESGWETALGDGLAVESVPGDHNSMLMGANALALAKVIG